jgi:hypothetical protein
MILLFSTSIAAATVGDLVDTTEVMSGIVGIDSTVIGEIHGTREIPLLFNRIVKDHLKAGFFVVVALEMPQNEIDGIRAAIQKKRFDKAQLAKSRFWSLAHDGRTSQAMLDLVKLLLALPERDIALIGFEGLPEPAGGLSRSICLLQSTLTIDFESFLNKPRRT